MGLGSCGAILLLLGLAITAAPMVPGFRKIPWYHYKPTFLVIRDLDSGLAVSADAAAELDRREAAGGLSVKYEQQLDAMALAQHQQPVGATGNKADEAVWLIKFVLGQYWGGKVSNARQPPVQPGAAANSHWGGKLSDAQKQQLFEMALSQQTSARQGLLSGWLEIFLGREYQAGHMTPAQRSRYEQQAVRLTVRTCPVVVLGNIVRVETDHVARAGEMQADFALLSGEPKIDGKVVPAPFDTGADGYPTPRLQASWFSVECSQPGKHTLEMTYRVTLRWWSGGLPLYQEDRKFTVNFEVVAQWPAGYFKLVDDPKLAGPIQASIAPQAIRRQAGYLTDVLEVTDVPATVAFDVICRSNGREFKIGTMACAKGASTYFDTTGREQYESSAPTTLPAAYDLILRSDEMVERRAVDPQDMWKGELVYPNVPVE